MQITGTSADDKKTALDLSKSEVEKIADLIARAIKIKIGWILNPTNGCPVTGKFAFFQAYSIFAQSQDFIVALNRLSNHDAVKPQGSKGDADPVADTESVEDLAAFIKTISALDDLSLASENIPQDPAGKGVPVLIADYSTDGQSTMVEG